MTNSSSPGLRRYTLALSGCYGLLAPLAGDAETFDSLPPPPALAPGRERQQLILSLVVNEADSGRIVPVTYSQGHYLVRSADLAAAGLPTDQLNETQTDVSTMQGVRAVYDRHRQRLLLTVPPEWLPAQTFTGQRGGLRYQAGTSTGVLLNYDIYGSRIDGGANHLAVWNEWRLFGPYGHLSSDGVLQQPLGGKHNSHGGYVRYDTFWANQDEAESLSFTAGDLITNSLSWSSSVRLGGLQIARDFTVRPDIVTYPLPAFAGQAAVPTTVDLFVNGYRASSSDVRPGPYAFTNLPFINGAGEAVIVTTDALGRRVTTTEPFYVSSRLLQPGLSDYSFSAGALRRAYGLRNADYGAIAASGSYRRGIYDALTLEGHAEGARSLALGGLGALFKLARWGVANAAMTHSVLYGDNGNQYDWGYQYHTGSFSLGTQHTIRSKQFGNLAILDNGAHHLPDALWTLNRRSAQYYASIALDRYGSLGANYFDIGSAAGEATRLLNLSWSRNLWGNSSVFISGTFDRQQQHWSGAISFIIPFGMLNSVNLGIERDRPGSTAQRITLSRAMPTDGGFSGDLSYARESQINDYRQATLNWRNPYLETSGGYYGVSGQETTWAELRGALVAMDQHVLVANQLNNAFALVKTGYPDVQVRYENQPAGRTSQRGYLLIPGISAYYPGKYEIDAQSLPMDVAAEKIEQRVAVRRRSGYLVHFPIKPLRAANVILHDQQGQPLPVGTRLTRANLPIEYVGWDGIAWLDNLTGQNPLRATTPDGRHCHAHLTLPGGQLRISQTYGPLICPLSVTPLGSADDPL